MRVHGLANRCVDGLVSAPANPTPEEAKKYIGSLCLLQTDVPEKPGRYEIRSHLFGELTGWNDKEKKFGVQPYDSFGRPEGKAKLENSMFIDILPRQGSDVKLAPNENDHSTYKDAVVENYFMANNSCSCEYHGVAKKTKKTTVAAAKKKAAAPAKKKAVAAAKKKQQQHQKKKKPQQQKKKQQQQQKKKQQQQQKKKQQQQQQQQQQQKKSEAAAATTKKSEAAAAKKASQKAAKKARKKATKQGPFRPDYIIQGNCSHMIAHT
jgi:hypothetical protein